MLVIDCVTPALSVALFDGEDCLASTHRELGRGHAEALLPAIAALPEGGRCDNILVDIGPGSFTGLRVGIAAALALGSAWKVPVRGYGCLDLVAAMARRLIDPGQDFVVTMVGGHGEIFWSHAPSSPTEASIVHSTPINALVHMLQAPLMVGSAAQMLVEHGIRATALPLLPKAESILLLPEALRDLPPSPVYGRAADAKPMPPRQSNTRLDPAA